jgi:hypothetical protein
VTALSRTVWVWMEVRTDPAGHAGGENAGGLTSSSVYRLPTEGPRDGDPGRPWAEVPLPGVLAHARAASGLDGLDGALGIVVDALLERHESGPVASLLVGRAELADVGQDAAHDRAILEFPDQRMQDRGGRLG